ncbi:MAG: acyl-CoA dehydrogenase C-terminal domain-containing protein, partial [Desulfosalsimonas sp.]
AMDLLARKLGMKKGTVFMDLMAEMQKTVEEAGKIPRLEGLALEVENAVSSLGDAAMHMGKNAASQKLRTAFAHAMPFLDVLGDVIMAWMLLWRASVAEPGLEKILKDADKQEREKKISKNKNAAFYEGQVQSAFYFIQTHLPVTIGRINAIKADCSAVVDIPEPGFGG